MQPLSERPPRSVWELVDDSFDLYRSHFLFYALLATLLYLPGHFLYFGLASEIHLQLQPYHKPGDSSTDFLLWLAEYALQLVLGQLPLALGNVFLTAGIAHALHDQLRGTTATLRPTITTVLRRFPTLLAIALWSGFLSALAALVFLVGQWGVTPRLLLIAPVAIEENRGVWRAYRHAMQIVSRSAFWRVLSLSLALGALLWLTTRTLEGVVLILLQLVPAPWIGAGETKALRQFTLGEATYLVTAVLLAPLPAIATYLAYIDARIRREAYDLVVMADETGVALAPDAFGGFGEAQR